MNILYLHNSALISGGERSLLALWKSLDRAKFTPIVMLPCEGPFADAARQEKVEVMIMAIPSFRFWEFFALRRVERELLNVLHRLNIVLIHSYTPRNNMFASLVARPLKIPVIWHERNLIYGRERDVSRMLSSAADALICNSQAVARRFMSGQRVPENVRVILNGVDTAHFIPTSDPERAKQALGLKGRKVVGLFANLEERKGVGTFLQVMHVLGRSREDVTALVVGGTYGSDPRRLVAVQEQISSMGLNDRIMLTGFQADVRPYLAACDVVCNVTEKEACSRAILEAMSCGIPVVAFRDGGNPELIVEKETGELVPVGDTGTFASRLQALLDDGILSRRMSEKARERAVAYFDAARNAQQTQQLYEELIGRRS